MLWDPHWRSDALLPCGLLRSLLSPMTSRQTQLRILLETCADLVYARSQLGVR